MAITLKEKLDAFKADHLWVDENRERLLELYPEQWIAVKNKEIIAVSDDFESLVMNLPDAAHTCIKFLSREPIGTVL